MSTTSGDRPLSLNQFFAASEARVDRWRTLNRVARALTATGPGSAASLRLDPKELLAELAPLEEFCAYPGPGLMGLVHERLQTGDRTGFARLIQRISGSHFSATAIETPPSRGRPRRRAMAACPTSCRRRSAAARRDGLTSRSCACRPPTAFMWQDIRETFRRLRRVEDEFVYRARSGGQFFRTRFSLSSSIPIFKRS